MNTLIAMSVLAYTFLLIALFGHVVLCVAAWNRLHALPIAKRWLDVLDKPHLLLAAAVPLWVTWQLFERPDRLLAWITPGPQATWLSVYSVVCCLATAWAVLGWLSQVARGPAAQLLANHTTVVDVARQLDEKPIGAPLVAILDRIPRHEMFQLHIHEKTLVVPRAAAALDGLTLVHLSDLHYSGRIRRSYFEAVMEHANELDGDVVAVTGDILDAEHCREWLAPTLGRLKARLGVYFVLGNHDRRIRNTERVRRELAELGLIDLGGCWKVVTWFGQQVLLAGNEWPWFGPRPEVPAEYASDTGAVQFRLLLSHSPDQFAWARRHGFDLMLAGHTHGGQIRLPLAGAVFSPSMYGVKYASGVFFEPPTLMHVSRGISGLEPIRLGCPPELARLVLRFRRDRSALFCNQGVD